VSEHFPLLYHLAANAGRNSNSQAHWDRCLEETWDDPGRNWPAKNELIESLVSTDATVLDVGCGTGGILRYLRKRGYENLHGLEISAYAVERLRSEGISMHVGRLPEISAESGSFDVVIASQVLEHIVRRDRFAKEIWRVLRPGGRVLVFVPDDCLGPIAEPEHVIKYNRDSLGRFLGRHFNVLDVKSIRDPNHEMPVLFALARKPAQAGPAARR
jgi:SAM-dependent methyltransferase